MSKQSNPLDSRAAGTYVCMYVQSKGALFLHLFLANMVLYDTKNIQQYHGKVANNLCLYSRPLRTAVLVLAAAQTPPLWYTHTAGSRKREFCTQPAEGSE